MKHSVSYSKTLAADLQASWSVLRDFGSIIHWVRGGEDGSISISGTGIGMTRDLNLPSVGDVQHRLEELDESNRLIVKCPHSMATRLVRFSAFHVIQNTPCLA